MDSIAHKTVLICIIICLCAGCVKSDKTTSEEPPVNASEGLFKDADIHEQLIYDSPEIVIKALSLHMNTESGPVLLIFGENKSDVDYIVTIKNSSVNNIIVEPEFEMKLNSNANVISRMVFPEEYLLTANVETFSSISFTINITDANGISFDTDQANIITSMTGVYLQKFSFPGSVVVDTNGVKISVMKKTNEEAVLSKQIYLYIDNSLPEDIIIETKETLINGIELESMFFHTVYAGKKSIARLSLRDSDIIENGIVSIEELIISFRVFSIFGTIINVEGCQITFDKE